MEKTLAGQHQQTFEGIRHSDEEGNEHWYARELQPVLEYAKWERFRHVLDKAMVACAQSGQLVGQHFCPTERHAALGSGAVRAIQDYCLSRYACYLVVQNADPSKAAIAHGQTYFAVQTRRQELQDGDAFRQLDEDAKRLFLRQELREHNRQLVAAARGAGVESSLDFAVFQNHGYQGLYGGLGVRQIHQRKGLKGNQKILDHMGSTELAANLFRATQTEEKLRREQPGNKRDANRAHHEVGQKVRQAIRDIGGDLPEDLPTPEQGIPALERGVRKLAPPTGD